MTIAIISLVIACVALILAVYSAAYVYSHNRWNKREIQELLRKADKLSKDLKNPATPLTDDSLFGNIFGPKYVQQTVVVKKDESPTPSRLWFVVKESPVNKDGERRPVEIWATTESDKILKLKSHKNRRIFFTTVLAYSSDSAITKADASRTWTELEP